MSLVAASQISLAYGARVLFERASFAVGPHDRIGLVGANGTGKSTLLKILAGEMAPDLGELSFRRGTRVGYLPQDGSALPDLPLIEAVLASVPGRSALEQRLAATEAALSAAADQAEQLELSQDLAELHEELDHFEEHFGRRRAERILLGLGFAPSQLGERTAVLSGGWRMRAALSGLLLTDPDLLLLDEPTNHLDVPTLTWFDAFLRGKRKALLLVSHDRQFLNRQIERVLALEPEGLRAYAGDYDDYRRERAEEELRLLAMAERQEQKRAQLERFIERFGAKNTKARQAKSKEKQLARMEEIQVLEHRDTLRFQFAEAPRSGREVLRLEGVGKAFGPRVVYRAVDARVQRGQRVGVIGPNGAGKTTLLRLVAGELSPDAGRIVLGHGVLAGYFAQQSDPAGAREPPAPAPPAQGPRPVRSTTTGALDPERTILDTLWELVPDRGEAYVRGVAGSFLFSGDEVEKKVGVLSGGERARVALAKLLLVPFNLLILDEPTNHLDLDSSEALIEALQAYQGTLLFVSHDRSFLNDLATVIWEVKQGGILPFPGNLDDWLYHEEQLNAARPADAPDEGPTDAEPAPLRQADRRRAQAEARNARLRRERPLREEIERLEARIAELEAEERDTTAALADPGLYQDFSRARPLIERQAGARDELARRYAEWEQAQRRLEEMRREAP
ncbi:MAG TPA: ABC-F family ATP-binding cassette domain-containing protein [Anaeromyxobacter sp.]|nr:ABC-F family ATP-binding cassette domain-containing protein [Anaeromyxobacter sp.]